VQTVAEGECRKKILKGLIAIMDDKMAAWGEIALL